MSAPDPSFQHAPVIALLGGVIDPAEYLGFCEEFGRLLASSTGFRFCVSGFKGGFAEEDPDTLVPSFAYAVARAAVSQIGEKQAEARFMTRYGSLDRESKRQFLMGDARPSRGRNERARGLSIVSEADMVCLGAGGRGTRDYFDFARAMDKPVLPLPFAGGAAREIWGTVRQELADEFGSEVANLGRWRRTRLSNVKPKSVSGVAQACVEAIRACVRLRCLALMPFSEKFDWVYRSIIQPACETVCADAIRLDLGAQVGDIISTFKSELGRADCAIAVVTEESANVLYEVGYAHALGTPVILLSEDAGARSPETDLTFYLRSQRTVWYPPEEDDARAALAKDELVRLLSGLRRNPETF